MTERRFGKRRFAEDRLDGDRVEAEAEALEILPGLRPTTDWPLSERWGV